MSPEQYNTPAYNELLTAALDHAAPHHQLRYSFFGPSVNAAKVSAPVTDDFLKKVDVIVCLGRDVAPNPSYSDADPTHNIALTPSAKSNVAYTVQLMQQAEQAGNSNLKVIFSGGMNNRYLDTRMQLPKIAALLDVSVETLLVMSEADFSEKLQTAKIDESQRQDLLRQFREYPRITEARLLAEHAQALGLDPAKIIEEDTSVDTVSSMLYAYGLLPEAAKNVLVVSAKDHLPRTLWITDFIFPDSVELAFAEADPDISVNEFDASCQRERKSLQATIRWIGDTHRDQKKIRQKIYDGYLNPETRRSVAQIATNVQKQS